MKQLTELEILRHENDLLYRRIKLLEAMAEYDREKHRKEISRLQSVIKDLRYEFCPGGPR